MSRIWPLFLVRVGYLTALSKRCHVSDRSVPSAGCRHGFLSGGDELSTVWPVATYPQNTLKNGKRHRIWATSFSNLGVSPRISKVVGTSTHLPPPPMATPLPVRVTYLTALPRLCHVSDRFASCVLPSLQCTYVPTYLYHGCTCINTCMYLHTYIVWLTDLSEFRQYTYINIGIDT